MTRTITLDKNEAEHQALHERESSIREQAVCRSFLKFTMEDVILNKKLSFVTDTHYLAYSVIDRKEQILSMFEHYLDEFLKSIDNSSLKAADQEGEAL